MLLSCPGIRDAAVTALSDEIWGDRITALVVGRITHQSLDEWCRQHFPSHLRPRRFLFVDTLPRNAMGKLVRMHLPELARSLEQAFPC